MTVGVVATVEASNWPPRVRLDVTGTTELTTTVIRLDPDGSTVPVRTYDGNPLQLPGSIAVTDNGDGTASASVTDNGDGTAVATVIPYGDGTAPETVSGGSGLLYDYEMPYGAPVTYTSVETPANVSSAVTVPETRVWLVHPGVPALSQPVTSGWIRPGSFAKRVRAASRGVFYPMGRATPIVQTDGARKAISSSLTVLTQGDQTAAFDQLLSDGSPLLLNIPAGAAVRFASCYISVGDAEFDPVIDMVTTDLVDIVMPFDVVDRPEGGTQAERTLLDLLDYATLNDLMVAYPTFTALLAGP